MKIWGVVEIGMCIVVVDDEPDVRTLVSEVLEDEGYDVLSFSHPVPVARLQETEERPELFLIDIMLPEMDGITLAGRLKDEGFETTPKIAMSASASMLQVAKQSNLFAATLDKPFGLDDLLECVEQHIAEAH